MARKLKPDIAERNIALSGQIMHYLLKHPQVLDVLPDDFKSVILPEDDMEVTMFNLELLRKRGRQDKPIVLARVKSSAEKITSQPSIFVPIAA